MKPLSLLAAALVGYVVGCAALLVWGGRQLFEGTVGQDPLDDEFYSEFGAEGGAYYGSEYDTRD